MDNEFIDLDNHMKISNFLIYLQSIGIINETQRIEYSKYIQDYLKEREDNLNLLNQLLNLLEEENLYGEFNHGK